MITTILFDLDGTLLPMDTRKFAGAYFEALSAKTAGSGYEAGEFINGIVTGIKVMIDNDGRRTNEEVFWDVLRERCKMERKELETFFVDFYQNEFDSVQGSCGHNEQAPRLFHDLKRRGYRVALATNPVFPDIATRKRVSWAGIEADEFACYTTYENSCYCKPNIGYYEEVLGKLQVTPEECLMVGNDVDEDMVAEKIGMSVFLVTDCLLNRSGTDINRYPHGDYNDLRAYIESRERGSL